jgi:CRISPR/Cas system CMR-associated protein Cmr1 (group 7 of RAMP superfamily)
MDPFSPLTLGAVVLLVLVFMGLARAFQGHGVDELLDWKPTRDYETEVELEQDDVAQMIEAQNKLRRKRGAKELTEEDVQRQAAEDQQVRARGRGPFGSGGDEED